MYVPQKRSILYVNIIFGTYYIRCFDRLKTKTIFPVFIIDTINVIIQ